MVMGGKTRGDDFQSRCLMFGRRVYSGMEAIRKNAANESATDCIEQTSRKEPYLSGYLLRYLPSQFLFVSLEWRPALGACVTLDMTEVVATCLTVSRRQSPVMSECHHRRRSNQEKRYPKWKKQER